MKRVCSIETSMQHLSQVLQLAPRDRFEAAVREHQAEERHARGFSSWRQFVAMLFCQLAQAKSLREITAGLQASEGKLRHLGLPPGRGARLGLLVSLDATVIDLCAAVFDWAKFRTTKGR